MALIVACVVAFSLLEGPMRWVVIGLGALIEVGEAALMIWWSRRARPATGAPAIVGRPGTALGELRPSGQVRVDGEIWAARCPTGCSAGTLVTVVAVDNLELTVRPVGGTPGS